MKTPKDSLVTPDSAAPGGTKLGSSKPGKGERAFDLWLKSGLHDLYDKIASEPVPEELLRMIQEDRKK